jgi:hypothetical protein
MENLDDDDDGGGGGMHSVQASNASSRIQTRVFNNPTASTS